jgi:hypothetical protein
MISNTKKKRFPSQKSRKFKKISKKKKQNSNTPNSKQKEKRKEKLKAKRQRSRTFSSITFPDGKKTFFFSIFLSFPIYLPFMFLCHLYQGISLDLSPLRNNLKKNKEDILQGGLGDKSEDNPFSLSLSLSLSLSHTLFFCFVVLLIFT